MTKTHNKQMHSQDIILICDLGGHEMQELKRRLLETEAQMTSILAAMEAVQKQTMNMHRQAAEEEESGEWQEEQVEEVEEVEAEVCHLNIY